MKVGKFYTNPINKPSNLTVIYSVTDGSEYASVNTSTGVVTGLAIGQATITASWEAVGNLYRRSVDVRLTLVGDGPERIRLERLARELPVSFLPPQPIDSIRPIMRKHDVYVLSSDAGEGWGAALNEALEEGMYVLGTYEAGASATLLHESDLFHSGDSSRLGQLLARCAMDKRSGKLQRQGMGEWSVAYAADFLVKDMKGI